MLHGRTIRAAKQGGAGGVDVRPDGTMFLNLSSLQDGGKLVVRPEKTLKEDAGAVL
jgi:hypothetical protein